MAEPLTEPNLYELACGDRRVTYSTSSITGEPQFTYTDADSQRSFSGDEIESVDTALGSEVTVTLEIVPDLHTIRLTMILPDIRMSPGEEVHLSTFGVITTARTTIAGPGPGVGMTYEMLKLDGTAKLIRF